MQVAIGFLKVSGLGMDTYSRLTHNLCYGLEQVHPTSGKFSILFKYLGVCQLPALCYRHLEIQRLITDRSQAQAVYLSRGHK